MISCCCADHRPIRIGDERMRLLTAPPVMTKSRGKKYPEKGLVNPPGRDTRALSPAGMSKEKKSPRFVAPKNRSH